MLADDASTGKTLVSDRVSDTNGDITIRELEPFAFWPQYSSAIKGWGGDDRGPDPYYCFHTPYTAFLPGTVMYRVRLFAAKASMGELTLRVHAFRPNAGMDAVMVAGLREPVEGLDGDLFLTLRIAALPGVVYALYGRFGEASDLHAARIEVHAEELGDDDSASYVSDALETSRFATDAFPKHARMSEVREPTLATPVSQPMTAHQMQEPVWSGLPEILFSPASPDERWSQAFAYQALISCGMAAPGATGLISGLSTSPLAQALAQRGCVVGEADRTPTPGAFDFVVSCSNAEEVDSPKALEELVIDRVTYMLRGGIGIFVFPCTPAASNGDGNIPDRQAIQRVALKVLGHGCDVAQLCFPPGTETHAQQVPFGLIVRR